eukprot:6575578-Ditylum_brightwellii.AAC.1
METTMDFVPSNRAELTFKGDFRRNRSARVTVDKSYHSWVGGMIPQRRKKGFLGRQSNPIANIPGVPSSRDQTM